MTEDRSAWNEAMEFLDLYGVDWPEEMERRLEQWRGAEHSADKIAHLNRIIQLMVRFHFPGQPN